MAPRRPSLIKRSKKTERKTASETYLVNSKYVGKECPPDKGTDMSYLAAIRWHHYMSDKSEAKKWGKEYLEKMGYSKEAKKFSSVSDSLLPLTFCWTAKLYLDGWKLSEERIEKTTRALVDITQKVIEEKKDDKEEKYQPSVYQLTLEKISEVIADIEDVIDNQDWSFSMYEYLQAHEIPQKYVSYIVKYYEPLLVEWKSITDRGEVELKEAYAHLSRSDIKSRIEFLEGLLNDLNRWADNQKKTRAPRKKKTITADKKVAKLNYQKEDNNLRLQSVNPTTIIGSNELWLYNTKYGVLSRYVAVDRGGLDIKGQTLLNYDVEKSSEKRVGRKAEEILGQVLTLGKVASRKYFEQIKGKTNEPKGRINNNTILLRVM